MNTKAIPMTRLNRLTVAQLTDKNIQWPYQPIGGLENNIVHIGLGAFHRGHQALYTQEAVTHSKETSWGNHCS